MNQLAKRVAKAVSEGKPALVACLTHYERSGNRIARLNEQQTHALIKIAERWQSPDAPQTKCDAWFELEDLCKAEGIDTPSSTTLSRHLRMQDGARRALNNGGLRAYQALAPRSDPTFRSGRAVGYGHTLHIDSSKRDVRCGSELEALQKERRSKKSKEWTTDIFYVGVDDATELPMAHAFVVGPARVDAEAILLREYVFRHKMLPREIIVDRGPENRSIWLQEFCLLHGIKLTYAMTAGSRANSQAEFVIGQVNAQVAHKLAGSTAPDKAGRAVDGRFKSRATARHAFLTVCELFKEFLYEFLPSIPKENGTTPLQCKEELLAKLSPMGTPQALDDAMLFTTSRRWDRYSVSEKRGIRLGSHFYTSDAVRMHLRGSMPDEIRSDSVDPSTLWVKFGSELTKAFHSSVTLMASLSTEERLWNHLIDKVVQRDNREDKRNQARKLHQSLQRAASAAPATQHLAPSSPQCEQQEGRKDSEQSSEWEKAWDQATPLA
jgi:putative transposase